MHSVLVLGAGKIGRTIARFLAEAGDYEVLLADGDARVLNTLPPHDRISTRVVDAASSDQLFGVMRHLRAVVSALSFSFNPLVAETAAELGLSYFDLTEDVETTRRVRHTAQGAKPGRIVMPQCGLAPGFVCIAGAHLAKQFDKVESLHLRVGALPEFPTNALKYNLTWSTDGLINEYCNLCETIHDGKLMNVLPLEGLEHISLDGVRYEAFNTSGGLGTLCETLAGRVHDLNYKTIRYDGHRQYMMFLLNELKLNERRDLLKNILENAVPVTYQDVVVVFCTATGKRNGQLVQISDARKVYAQSLYGETTSAIQLTTAAGVCAVLDLHLAGKLAQAGFVKQEDVHFDDFLTNRFGQHYHSSAASRVSVSAAVH